MLPHDGPASYPALASVCVRTLSVRTSGGGFYAWRKQQLSLSLGFARRAGLEQRRRVAGSYERGSRNPRPPDPLVF
jgi:hypothetical protein